LNIFFDTPERSDPAFVNDDTVTEHTRCRVTSNHTFPDVTPCNRPNTCDMKEHPHFSTPKRLFVIRRLQEPYHGLLYIRDGFVNYRIQADIDPLLRCKLCGFRDRTDVKADHNGIR